AYDVSLGIPAEPLFRSKKRLLAFSRRLHARIRKTRYMHKMRCLLINRRSLLLALRLLWKTPIFPKQKESTARVASIMENTNLSKIGRASCRERVKILND